jgi:hypothetical protein
MKQPDQLAYPCHVKIVMFSLKKQHVYQTHRRIETRMMSDSGKSFEGKTV